MLRHVGDIAASRALHVESPWLTDTSETSLQVPLNRAGDATKLKEELDEDLVLCVVSF